MQNEEGKEEGRNEGEGGANGTSPERFTAFPDTAGTENRARRAFGHAASSLQRSCMASHCFSVSRRSWEPFRKRTCPWVAPKQAHTPVLSRRFCPIRHALLRAPPRECRKQADH